MGIVKSSRTEANKLVCPLIEEIEELAYDTPTEEIDYSSYAACKTSPVIMNCPHIFPADLSDTYYPDASTSDYDPYADYQY